MAALGHAEAAAGTHHLAYEKVVLSPATARAMGYAVSEDETAVKVSGRKGLGVKADDLLDALVTKARAEIDVREDAREGERRADEERGWAARDISIGALRYFLLKFGRTKIITFDMEEALAFTGETGPYIQNGVVRARNIRAKLEDEGHPVAGLVARARTLDMGAWLDRGGRRGLEPLVLMARSDEVAEQAVRSRRSRFWPSTPSPWPRPSIRITRSRGIPCSRGDGRPRALRTLVVDAFVRHMEF